MDKLTKDQKDEYATSFAALALYDGGVSNSDRLIFEYVSFVPSMSCHQDNGMLSVAILTPHEFRRSIFCKCELPNAA